MKSILLFLIMALVGSCSQFAQKDIQRDTSSFGPNNSFDRDGSEGILINRPPHTVEEFALTLKREMMNSPEIDDQTANHLENTYSDFIAEVKRQGYRNTRVASFGSDGRARGHMVCAAASLNAIIGVTSTYWCYGSNGWKKMSGVGIGLALSANSGFYYFYYVSRTLDFNGKYGMLEVAADMPVGIGGKGILMGKYPKKRGDKPPVQLFGAGVTLGASAIAAGARIMEVVLEDWE